MNHKRPKTIVLLAVLLLLIFLYGISKINFLSSLNGKFLNSYEAITYSVSNNFSNFIAGFVKDEKKCNLENIKNIESSIQNEEVKLLKKENKELKEALNFVSSKDYLLNKEKKSITTYLVGRDPVDRSIFIIDKGKRQGLTEGMPVVVGDGVLIGKLITVEENYSHFILITDNRSKIYASINNDEKISGIVEGDYNLSIEMKLIPIDKTIKKDDIIITSGTDELIPAGLIIGKVFSVEKMDNDIFQVAKLVPFIDYDNLSIVTVIK